MLFNSVDYLVFFCVVLVASWLLVKRATMRTWLLVFASYYFYAKNNHWLIVLILVSTFVDYFAALGIADSQSPRRKKALLAVSVVMNLGMLGFFKYFNFFMDSAVTVGGLFGASLSWAHWQIALPVGISFYTFQSMSYTFDVYQGKCPVERSWSRFAMYVAYFPQLVAGPIMRASEFIPQLNRQPSLDKASLERALMLIMRGLVKKIVLADFLAFYSEALFAAPGSASTLTAWLGIYAFTFQIYFDFSGYTDIAIGCSRLMGYHLPDNFRLPYIASGFSDFWRRWHISLSSWLRDYLYIPLGGGRMATAFGVYRNLMITMVLGGLWHGAAWNFVIWGALHGGFLIVERLFGRRQTDDEFSLLGLLARRILVFHAIVLTWIVFRAASAGDIWRVLQALFSFTASSEITLGMAMAALLIAISWISQFIAGRWDVEQAFLRLPIPVKASLYALLAVVVVIFNSSGPKPFIYFQF